MKEVIHNIFSHTADVIDIIGVLILLYGFVKAIIRFIIVEIGKGEFSLKVISIQAIRREIGIYILLALDFLIASDIINTIFDISQNQLLELSVMIILRTGIGHFLGKEINEIDKK